MNASISARYDTIHNLSIQVQTPRHYCYCSISQARGTPPTSMATNSQSSEITATIILGGSLDSGHWVQTLATESDFVIAADYGLAHCLKLGITPRLCVGDYDSVDIEDLTQAYQLGWNIISFPREKDMTDGELAIREAVTLGARRIHLLAGFSGDNRVDHGIAHFFQLAYFSETGIDIRMVDHDKEAHILTANAANLITGRRHASVSLIPMDKNVTGVSTQGLRYELNGEALHFGSTRSLSNEMLHDSATIHLQTGLLLVVIVAANLMQPE